MKYEFPVPLNSPLSPFEREALSLLSVMLKLLAEYKSNNEGMSRLQILLTAGREQLGMGGGGRLSSPDNSLLEWLAVQHLCYEYKSRNTEEVDREFYLPSKLGTLLARNFLQDISAKTWMSPDREKQLVDAWVETAKSLRDKRPSTKEAATRAMSAWDISLTRHEKAREKLAGRDTEVYGTVPLTPVMKQTLVKSKAPPVPRPPPPPRPKQ